MIPKDSGRKENWYIRFITLCMSNFNIPENIKIVIWEDQVKHGVISIFNQDDVICETPFVLGGTSHG